MDLFNFHPHIYSYKSKLAEAFKHKQISKYPIASGYGDYGAFKEVDKAVMRLHHLRPPFLLE